MEANSVNDDKSTSTADLVRSVLSQVQAEFSVWTWTYSRRALRALSFPLEPFDPPNGYLKYSVPATDFPKASCHEARTCTVAAMQTTYSPNGEIESETSTPLQVINLIPDLTPHPPYESCAPISRNLFRGDDADAMAFVPYADDPLFNQIDHTLCYGSFSWQEEFDPDRELQ